LLSELAQRKLKKGPTSKGEERKRVVVGREGKREGREEVKK